MNRSITENYRGSVISASPSIPGKYDRWNSWVDGDCIRIGHHTFLQALSDCEHSVDSRISEQAQSMIDELRIQGVVTLKT